MSAKIDQEILDCLPNLRAFARALTGTRDRADDLVRDAVLCALSVASQYKAGVNFRAWIFTILHNLYFNVGREGLRLARPPQAADLETYATAPAKQAGLELDRFRRAFNTLSAILREALVLADAGGFRYEEVAAICGCPIGTIKNRVFRARSEIQEIFSTDGVSRCGAVWADNLTIGNRAACALR